jgi:hypothetical protein
MMDVSASKSKWKVGLARPPYTRVQVLRRGGNVSEAIEYDSARGLDL